MTCVGILPHTRIACGATGSYCSTECRARAMALRYLYPKGTAAPTEWCKRDLGLAAMFTEAIEHGIKRGRELATVIVTRHEGRIDDRNNLAADILEGKGE